jgi:hypothetical protein
MAINNAWIEYQTSRVAYMSASEARENGVFVSSPALKNQVIQWLGSKYKIREAWIEKDITIKNSWLFFRQVTLNGYQLKINIDSQDQDNKRSFSSIWDRNNYLLVCNNSIEIDHSIAYEIWYTEISEPLPKEIECVVLKRSVN